MIRQIENPGPLDPQSRPTERAIPLKVVEQASDAAERPAPTVGQAAVVELGSAAQSATIPQAAPATYTRSTVPLPDPATQTKNAPQGEADAATAAGGYKIMRGADGVEYALSGRVLVSSSTIRQDPEGAIRELTQIRQAALTPPTTPTELQIAARVTLDVQRAQLELARKRYLNDATSADPTLEAHQSPQPPTDIKA